MREAGSYDFASQDPKVQSEIDARIWRMRTEERLRVDQIDIRLGCSPKRVKEALSRPDPNPSKETRAAIEPWQFPESEQVRSPVVAYALQSRVAVAGMTISAAAAKREPARKPVPDRAPPKDRSTAPRPRGRPRKDGVVNGTHKYANQTPLPAQPEDGRVVACQPRIEHVISTACKVFDTNRTELGETGQNLRVEACRNAIYLILDYEGIGPEVVAPYFGRTIREACAAHTSSVKLVLEKRQATSFFTKMLCEALEVDFRRLLVRCI